MPSDLRSLAIDGVNVERQADRLILYTPAFGPATGTNEFGAELVVRVVQPATPVQVGQTALVELVSFADGAGNMPIPDGGAVLSGHGRAAAALRDLWGRVTAHVAASRALLRVETSPAVAQSTGGTPVLVHQGRRWVAGDRSVFAAGRHPRTLVGSTAERDVLLVTVDGRQPGYSVGMTLTEAADLMLALGATEALNLDGGGSTTFVAAGQVLNRPSDRLVRRDGGDEIVALARAGDTVVGPVERPVTTAVVVVLSRDEGAAVPPRGVDPLAGEPLGPVRELALPAPSGDPGSRPGADQPALLAGPPPSGPSLAWTAAAAALLVVVAAATVAHFATAERRLRLPSGG